MASRFVLPREQVFDANGNPLSGAKLHFYTTGTSTPLDTYSDSALTTPNANPVVADSAGRFGEIFMSTAATYKAVLKDSSDVTIWTADPAPAYLWTNTAAEVRSTIGAVGLADANVFTATQTVRSTDAGAAKGPIVKLDRNSASPAASDVLGAVSFDGRSSIANARTFAEVSAEIVDATDTSEDGRLLLSSVVAGTLGTRAKVGQGVIVGSPTGDDKGAGTLNAVAVYAQGQPVAGAYVRLHDANASAQAWTLTTWTTVRLTTEAEDAANICTLASNQITLAAGTYYIRASQTLYGTEYAMLRLRNVTAGTTLVVGRATYSPSTGGAASCNLDGSFTVTASQAIELQCYPSNGESAGGLVFPGSPGEAVYQNAVEIWRLT